MKNYKSSGRRWFIEYLPDSIYRSFSNEDERHYSQYRNYHRFMDSRSSKIEKLEKEISELKKEINKRKNKIYRHAEYMDGVKIDGVVQETGFKDKMLFHYSFIKQYDKNIQFDCWIELRDKSSLSFKKKKGVSIERIELKRGKKLVEKTSYKGNPLQERIIWYSFVRTEVNGKKRKKSIYCGSIEKVKDELGRLFKKDVKSRGIGFLKMEILKLSRQYTKCKTYESSWIHFMSNSHNITTMVDWGLELGEIERNKWGT